MNRTVTAALLGALIAFAAVAGFGIFLGLGTTGPVVAGLVLGGLAGLLLWGASRRAETFHEPAPSSSSSSPGAPDQPDASPSDPTGPDRDGEDR